MSNQRIDSEKLSVQLRSLRKDDLLALLDRAIELLPKTRIAPLVAGYINLESLKPDGAGAGEFAAVVRDFREKSLRGDYYEDFNVNSRNYTKKSKGTKTWIAEIDRLFARCAAEARKGNVNVYGECFEILIDLLREIDNGNDDIVFFADEAGSWQVGVNWEEVLPAYFACLSATADPDEYAQKVHSVISDFVDYSRKDYLREARGVATPAQKKRLR